MLHVSGRAFRGIYLKDAKGPFSNHCGFKLVTIWQLSLQDSIAWTPCDVKQYVVRNQDGDIIIPFTIACYQRT